MRETTGTKTFENLETEVFPSTGNTHISNPCTLKK